MLQMKRIIFCTLFFWIIIFSNYSEDESSIHKLLNKLIRIEEGYYYWIFYGIKNNNEYHYTFHFSNDKKVFFTYDEWLFSFFRAGTFDIENNKVIIEFNTTSRPDFLSKQIIENMTIILEIDGLQDKCI